MITLDALSALALLLISTMLILMLLNRPVALEAHGFEPAPDMMGAMKAVRLDELAANPRYPVAASIYTQGLTSTHNATLAEAIGELYFSGKEDEAESLAKEFAGHAFPAGLGMELLAEKPGLDCEGHASQFSCVYGRQGPAERNFVSVDRHFIYYGNMNREMRLVIYK